MRSAGIVAALAAGVVAVPFQDVVKRDMVTETDIVVQYVTQVVTVTAGAPAPDQTPNVQNKHGDGHRHHHGGRPNFYHTPPSQPPAQSPPPQNDPPQNSPPQNDPPQNSPPQNSPPSPSPPAHPTPSPTLDSGSGDKSGGGSGSGSGGDDSGSAGSSYADIAVYHHNIHRKNHSASAISWDAGLAKSAADIAATCIYEHNTEMDGGGYGQNIAAGVEPNNISAIITNLFYNGEVSNYDGLYGQANPSMALFEEWGHFSQIVWKETTHFGCATQDCSSQGLGNVGGNVAPYFTVCNYQSPGNVQGQYGKSVGEPLGHPTANWNAGM